MKKKLLSPLLAVSIVLGVNSGAFAEDLIDLSDVAAHGVGENKIQVNNIRVDQEVPNVFDPDARPDIVSTYFNLPFTFDRASLHLIPDLDAAVIGAMGASSSGDRCASLSLRISDAFNGGPIENASVSVGTETSNTNASGLVTISDLLAINSSFVVSANGFTTVTQRAALNCDQETSMGIALNPLDGSGQIGIGAFRVTLTWGANPSDLDSHLTGPNSLSAGPIDEANRYHVYFGNKNIEGAVLDVDDTSSFGPETISVSPESLITGLRPGIYRYTVHHFSGSATIATSFASVSLTLPDGTTRRFTPPASSNLSGTGDIWTVFELSIGINGQNSVFPINTYGTSSAGSVRSRREPVRDVDSSIDWVALPEK